MEIRPYQPERDLAAVQRIWYEIGWIDSEAGANALADYLATGSCLTAALDGEAECMAHTTTGAMRYVNSCRNPRLNPGLDSRISEDLPFLAVTAVMTSRIARQLGLALKLTATQVAAAAVEGLPLAILGIFDQGFYDRLGFGTGSYESMLRFDPATLRVDAPYRPPKRLTGNDWRAVHGAMMLRRRGHGGCVLSDPLLMKGELGLEPGGFGLGYEREGTLTHCLWFGTRNVDHGPYNVKMLAYQDGRQLLELLGVLKSLADQVSLIELPEPPDIQLEGLLEAPFRNRRNTRKSDFSASHQAHGWWQLRVLDVAACVERRHWPGDEVRFNLSLTDPISGYLEDGAWAGCGGDYWISVGPGSYAEAGHREDLPTLHASVGAFSRLWFGVAPASSLAVTDNLHVEDAASGGGLSETGSADLLERLDEALCMPQPKLGWDF